MTSTEWLIVAWVTMLGGCVGSFLNVVIYRWPTGKSVVAPASACPRCGHAIRWFHNIPVLGWIILRGRCFDCQARISVRYPLVEAYVATMFLSLAIIYLIAGRPLVEQESVDWLLRSVRFGLFALLCCTLMCIALMRYDNARVPFSLTTLPLLIGLGTPLLMPALREPPLTGLAMPTDQSVWLALGMAIVIAAARFDRQTARVTLASATLVALILGLWGTALVALVATSADFVARLIGFKSQLQPLPWTLWLWGASSVVLLAMRKPFAELWPDSAYKIHAPWMALAAIVLLSVVIKLMDRVKRSRVDD